MFIGAIIAMSLTLGGKTNSTMGTTTAMVTYTTATNKAMLFLSAPTDQVKPINMAYLIQPTGELRVFFQYDHYEVDGSCAVTHKNIQYIFGGKKNKRQVLKLDECKLKKFGKTVLGFDHESGGCSTSNGVIYLCFDLNDHKRCRKAESPDKEWSELTLSTFDHRLTSIATSTGTTFMRMISSIFDLFRRTLGRWLGGPIQCQN